MCCFFNIVAQAARHSCRRTQVLPRFFFFFFFFYLRLRFFVSANTSELPERNSTKTGHMLASEYGLKMLAYHLPKIGGPKPPFWLLSNSTTTLTAYVFRMKDDVDNRATALATRGSPTSSQNGVNFGPQTAWNWTVILPTLHKFCILLHC